MSDVPLVLVVDDEEALRLSIQDGLQHYSSEFRISTAPDGEHALNLLESESPALIVSDIRMPGIDGIELLLTCRKLYPRIPVILVSAYLSEQLERSARAFGAAGVIHKPLDLQELIAVIRKVLAEGPEKSETNGYLADFSLAGFLQLLAIEGKSCGVEIENQRGERGVLWLQNGQLWNAKAGDLAGRDAALLILGWEYGHMNLRPQPKKPRRRIKESLNFLLMEAARISDENGKIEVPIDVVFSEDGCEHKPANVADHKENTMSNMQEILSRAKDVDGFVAIGAFSPQGELLGEVTTAGNQLAELGALANDVLLKAQKSTDIMGVGRGNQVHIEAPKANILVRCLNENTDFAATESGRAHLHMVYVLEKEGNIALAKMKLESIIQELAPLCR